MRDRGKVRWEAKSPRTESGGTGTNIVPASTEKDFAGPAATSGFPFAAPLDDDQRIVQIGADRSARVLDAESGDVLAGPRQSVAGPDDQVVAHNGRLIVVEGGDARRIVAYDLAKLGEPRVLYTAPAADARFEDLTPCGADRVCLVETVGYDAKTARVVAVDTDEGGDVWRREVPSTDGLLPVGEAVLATQNTSPVQVTLVDAAGKAAWTEAGVVGRLDAGNLLKFSKALSTSADDPALAGGHLGDDWQPLGSLTDVRSSTCSWDTRYLACVAAEDFVIQRFTE
jgi:molecular chaperone HscA